MDVKSLGPIGRSAPASLALVCLALVMAFAAALPAPALAQSAPRRAPLIRHLRHTLPVRPQIEVTPSRLLYRQCTEWLELQYRPSGPVLYPQTRCWWVRG